MAQPGVIDAYVARLRASLRWRPDAEDLADEAEDHLRETAARLVREGLDPDEAAARAVARFGDSTEIAHAFASTPSGGTAMPTSVTRTCGTVGVAAALCWLLAALVPVLGLTERFTWSDLAVYLAFMALAALAAAMTTVVVTGLLVRSGGLGGVVAAAVLLGALAATVSLLGVTWAWPIGGLVFAATFAGLVWRLRSTHTRSAATDWLAVAAWPVGVVVFVALTRLEVGPLDEYGDRPVAYAVGFATGALLFAAALLRLGTWARSEVPADTVTLART
jgi:hypothetical protein